MGQIRPNKQNKCVSGNGSENFRHMYFLIIFFSRKSEKIQVSPVNLGRVGLP